MGFEYKEMQKLLGKYKWVEEDFNNFLISFLTEMGMRAFAQTKKLTPVDTGNLRNRWELSDVFKEGNDLYIVLFNPAEYASHVEDGHMQRKRFLPFKYLRQSPANREMLTSLKQKYGEDLKGIMLKDKWIQGHFMARISINKIHEEMPKRFEKAFNNFINKTLAKA